MKLAVWLKRSAILLFWFAVLTIFLMLPRIISSFNQEKSLSIFAWPLLLDPVFLQKFEKDTGIKLHITYFENGPALLNKVAATQGQGYDLIIPDDHSLEIFIKQKLLKKIDKTKLNFYSTLQPMLLNIYADPENQYSIPYYWGVYGIGYNSIKVKPTDIASGWQLLFNSPYKICMTDDPREAILLASVYLFGSIDALRDPEARQAVKQLLIEQKKRVQVYSISRSDTLLQTDSCDVAAIMSPEVWRLKRELTTIDMTIPKPSFVVVDSFAIPKTTTKDELIYIFLNYLYQPSVIAHHVTLFGYCSPTTSFIAEGQQRFCPIERFSEFDYFRSIISDDEINSLWIEVLAG